jgi:tripartite ATP-independent transporter DctM subunit
MSIIISFLLIGLVLGAIACGAPLFTIIGGGAALLFKFVADGKIAFILTDMKKVMTAPGIISIPLFVFAGFIFAESKSSTRLIKLSDALIGWMPGGLAVVTVMVSTVFTALTGGSGVTIIACGGILLPALIKNHYDDDFSLGLVTSAASSGVLFIPSLPIIIYGVIAEVDVSLLFIAATIPAILIMMILVLYGIYYGAKTKVPTTPFSVQNLLESLWEIKWVLPLPIIVIGGIYGGFITVSEAASATVVYALITECLIYQEIPAKQLVIVAIKSMRTVGAILMVLVAALGLTSFMVDQDIPQMAVDFISEAITNKYVFLLCLNAILLVVGCLMDIFSAIVVMVPLIKPMAEQFGIDPLHLGVIFLANLTVGYITPPVGMNLFISSLRFKAPVIRLYRVVVPALILLLITLALITYIPWLSTFLVQAFGLQKEAIIL